METDFEVICPYCGEEVTLFFERDVSGTFVQDCEICCNPWQVHVERDGDERYVQLRRADGSE